MLRDCNAQMLSAPMPIHAANVLASLLYLWGKIKWTRFARIMLMNRMRRICARGRGSNLIVRYSGSWLHSVQASAEGIGLSI